MQTKVSLGIKFLHGIGEMPAACIVGVTGSLLNEPSSLKDLVRVELAE